MANVGSLIVTIGADATALKAGMATAVATVNGSAVAMKNTSASMAKSAVASAAEQTAAWKSVGTGMSKVGIIMAAVAAAGALAFGKLMNDSFKFAETLTMMNDRTGMSLKSLQEWQYMLKFLDVDMSTLQSTMSMFVNRMKGLDMEGGDFTKTIAALGVAMKDSSGQTRMTADIYQDAINALSGMTNPTDKALAASALFGRSWMELMPIIGVGADKLDELRAQYKALNIEMSDIELQNLNDMGDKVDAVKLQFQYAFATIANDFLPALKDQLIPYIQNTIIPALKSFGNKIAELIDWFNNLSPFTKNAFKDIGTTLLVGGLVITGIGNLIIWVGKAKTALEVMGIAGEASWLKMLGPIALVVAAVGGLIGLIAKSQTEAGKLIMQNSVNNAPNMFGGGTNWIGNPSLSTPTTTSTPYTGSDSDWAGYIGIGEQNPAYVSSTPTPTPQPDVSFLSGGTSAIDESTTAADEAASAQSKLADEIRSVTDAISAQAKAFIDYTGMFERSTQQQAVSGTRWLSRLAGQVKDMIKWQSNLASIQARGLLSGGMMNDIRSMGPGYANQVAAIARMSDTQLAEANRLNNAKTGIGWEEGANSQGYQSWASGSITNMITLNVEGFSDPQAAGETIASTLKRAGYQPA